MRFVHALALTCALSAAPMLAFGQGSGPPGGAGPQAQPAAPAPAAKTKQLNPWIDCGIGALIFDEAGWAAAISNIIWDWGITGTTSAGLSPHTCNSKNAKTAHFIGVNYAVLAEETSRGDGRHLRAMLEILGCDARAHREIVSSIRSEFGPYLRQAGYLQRSPNAKAEGFYDLVQSAVSGEHAQRCGAA
jgi:hypothetical protein